MDYVVSPRELPQAEVQEYEVKYLKSVETADGQTVQVIDRTEVVTIPQLEDRIANIDAQIASLQDQKADIVAIKTDIQAQEEVNK